VSGTSVTAAAVALVAAHLGTTAVLAVQMRAKGDLARLLARETAANTELIRSKTFLGKKMVSVHFS
jgi:hypothetical protein